MSELKFCETPKYVGKYCTKNNEFNLLLTYKPNPFNKFMVKLFFGLDYKDLITVEVKK